jgi:hypothetical protein
LRGEEYDDESFGILRLVVWYKLADVSEVLTASIFRAIAVYGIKEQFRGE